MAQALRPLMDSNDMVALSFYPFFKQLSGDVDEAFAWVAREFDGFHKQWAVAETGESAARIAFQNKAKEVVLNGSPEAQLVYYRKLLAFAEAKRFQFMISYEYTDYDALWNRIKQSSPGWFETWRVCGLLDATGAKRSAYGVWKTYFDSDKGLRAGVTTVSLSPIWKDVEKTGRQAKLAREHSLPVYLKSRIIDTNNSALPAPYASWKFDDPRLAKRLI